MERYVVKLAGIHDKTIKRGPHVCLLTTCSIETCNEFIIFIVMCTNVIDWNKFSILHCIYYFVRPKSLSNTSLKGRNSVWPNSNSNV